MIHDEVVSEIPEFSRGMRLFLIAAIVVVLNAVMVLPLATTLTVMAAAKSQWVEGATVEQVIQWSVWIVALSGSLDIAYRLVRERRWFAAFAVTAVLAAQVRESERVAALAVICTVVHVVAWSCFRRGPSIIQRLRRPRSEGG